MFTKISRFPNSGFQPPRRILRLLELCQRVDDMLMFYTIAAAVLLSIAVVPAYAAIHGAAGRPSSGMNSSNTLPADAVGRACSGQSWGNETIECLLAIDLESGRKLRDIRIVGGQKPDRTGPVDL